jgi:hypothetical protein
VCCFVNIGSIGCFVNTPKMVFCLTHILFMSIGKFASRVEGDLCVVSMFCEQCNFNDLFGTCLVMLLQHS